MDSILLQKKKSSFNRLGLIYRGRVGNYYFTKYMIKYNKNVAPRATKPVFWCIFPGYLFQ